MNTKAIIGVVAIIIIAAGVGIYYSKSSSTEIVKNNAMMQKEGSPMDQEKDTSAMMQKENDTIMKKDEGATMDGGDILMKVGSYESYDTSKIAMASTTHDVVLFFRASWCPTCIALDKDIKANLKNIPASLTILDVNYDNSTELKKKYEVTYQHTFVQVDSQGNLIKKWSCSPTLASLVAEVEEEDPLVVEAPPWTKLNILREEQSDQRNQQSRRAIPNQLLMLVKDDRHPKKLQHAVGAVELDDACGKPLERI